MKLEFKLSNEKIQEIIQMLGPEININEIIGANANRIIQRYIKPLIDISDINPLIIEVINRY
jgi:hypothetical protein